MKIKVVDRPYSHVMAMGTAKHLKPIKQKLFWRKLMQQLSKAELKAVGFTYEKQGMERLGADEPALFLMNHSSFTDLQITSELLADRQYHIVMTKDGMVGKAGLMQKIGCIEAKKFIMDTTLIKDMKYAVDKLNSSILMFPEASYSFDGTQTPLPDSVGKCIKLLNIPVVMIRTRGAFLRDPLYNNLQKRKTKVSARVTYLLSKEDIAEKSVEEINEILRVNFTYDHFREQVEDGQLIDEDFRADGLERVLYKCVDCHSEGTLIGKGTSLVCQKCGDSHTLLPNGKLSNDMEETKFEFVSDWYRWEREQVRADIEDGIYDTSIDVDIMMLTDYESIYRIGEGTLRHNKEGFRLTGCDGQLDFRLSCKKSYSLYADYFWYELGDMISIGDSKVQYYCFPKNQEEAIVAKYRLAAEELYKMN